MEEMIAVENVSPESFADKYNQYNVSNGTIESPLGRKIIKCVSYTYQLDQGKQRDELGHFLGRGSGLILVSVEPRDDEYSQAVY